MRAALFVLATFALSATACSRGESSGSTKGNAPAPSSSGAAAMAAPSASASAAPKAASAPVTWTGAYTAQVGPLYIPREGDVPNPKDWEGVKWRGDDAGNGLGAGTLTLVVDPTSGRVTGTSEGALGAIVVSGIASDTAVTATLSRKDATDDGFSGTAVGKFEGGKLVGTMHLSQANARVLREATFSLGKAP